MFLSSAAARRCAGWAAAVWAGVFAVLHFYWALGGGVGLAVSAGPDLAAERPAWFVAGGRWGVGVLCVAGAAVGGVPRGRPGLPAEGRSPAEDGRSRSNVTWVTPVVQGV